MYSRAAELRNFSQDYSIYSWIFEIKWATFESTLIFIASNNLDFCISLRYSSYCSYVNMAQSLKLSNYEELFKNYPTLYKV